MATSTIVLCHFYSWYLFLFLLHVIYSPGMNERLLVPLAVFLLSFLSRAK